ncbi:T9SS sorting signal type C domain-containing protein [Flavobacterium sp. LS2P90]|uniref:T9SS sorting signal type C domain-containing protein n=1 Tax=Flavobacterium xylosi TaxID=3230415 RepID=A0ABW6HTR5_9FLAO
MPFEEAVEVSLGFKTTIVGSFAIAINQKDGFFSTQNIFIEDKLLNVIHDLNESSYNFTTQAGTFNDRFVLRYTGKNLVTKSFKKPENTVLVSNVNKQITINSSVEMIDKVQVYDLLGRAIYQKMNINNNEFSIQNLIRNHQTLLVKVLLRDGQIVASKIMH